MKLDPQVLECLEWECRNGIRTAASIKLLQEEERAPAATAMTLQESQQPTSYKKENGPPRFDEPIPLFSTGIDLTQYVQYKDKKQPAPRQPAVPATEGSTKTLSEVSEVELIEARNQLYNAVAGEPVATLPADIHARLFHAIVG